MEIRTCNCSCFNKQTSIASFSPQYLFGRQPVLLMAIKQDAGTMLINMDDLDTWACVHKPNADLYKIMMPIPLKNLSNA